MKTSFPTHVNSRPGFISDFQSTEITGSLQEEKLIERIRLLEEKNALLLSVLNSIQRKLPADIQQHVAYTLIPPSTPQFGKDQATQKMKTIISKREIEVLELIKAGFCAKEIAEKLFISQTTVISHKKNLKLKFGAKNTAELIHKTADWF